MLRRGDVEIGVGFGEQIVDIVQIGSGKAAEFEFAVAADHALRGGEVELFEPDNGIVGKQAGGFVAQGGK